MTKHDNKFQTFSLFRGLLLASFLVLVTGLASATTTVVALTGAAETPPVKTVATGSGSITVDSDKTVSGTVTTTGLTGTVAHIHMGAPGVKGPVVIGLTKTGDNSWAVPAGSKLTAEQYTSYKAGDLYVNVHTAANKDGEIRGQLTP